MSNKTDLTVSKISNITDLQQYAEELKRTSDYLKSTNEQLIIQNKRILDILQYIEVKIDKQLQIHKKNILMMNPNHKVTFNKDQIRILEEKQNNNSKIISVLQKDFENIYNRKKILEQGLEEKVIQKKHQIQDKISTLKIQLKKLKLQQKQTQKKLKSYQNISEIDYLKEFSRMEEELRIFSAKYVKILAKYNKVTEQLAVASNVDPQFQIPEQIYNKQLQEKEQAQFTQYKSIVKLCTILSKRNDSENNKSNRIYTEKLKQLEKTILHLTELQKSIAFKETEALQGKKNIEMIKIKMETNDKIQKDLFRVSQGSTKTGLNENLRQKSYSSVKLMGQLTEKSPFSNKLRSQGSSFAKLPPKIK